MKFKSIIFGVACNLAMLSAAFADPGITRTPLGYQQITATDAAASLTVPTGANFAIIEVEAQAARYRDDSGTPTATVGMPIAVGEKVEYSGTLSRVRIIAQTTGAIVNVLYYK